MLSDAQLQQVADFMKRILNWAAQDTLHTLGYLALVLIIALILFETGCIIIKYCKDKYGENAADKKVKEKRDMLMRIALFFWFLGGSVVISQILQFGCLLQMIKK